MSNCKYCGKPAGFLKTKHKECASANRKLKENEKAAEKLRKRVIETAPSVIREQAAEIVFSHRPDYPTLQEMVSTLSETASIPPGKTKDILIDAWGDALEKALRDGVLDEREEQCLQTFLKTFDIPMRIIDYTPYGKQYKKALFLREIMNGNIPEGLKFQGEVPLNFQKSEKPVWGFPNTRYFEDKTKKRYEGGSKGVSVRIAKGVYYRTSTFKGHPIDYTERQFIDEGVVVLTTKHIYFYGSVKSMRIPYSKIVSFTPFDDGIIIMRDTQTAKPQIFQTGDAWFAFNLVSNLSRF